MRLFLTLLDLACGKPLGPEDDPTARRLQLLIAAVLLSLLFGSLWGVAAGCRTTHVLTNVWSVPMMILLSTLFAAPAGLLAWKLSGAPGRATDLLLSFALGVFGGTLVLGVLAPLVALYYVSSTWAGPLLGQGATALALLTGAVLFVRSMRARMKPGTRRSRLLPALVLLTIQAATLLQLISLSPPIFPERTPWNSGIDHLAQRR